MAGEGTGDKLATLRQEAKRSLDELIAEYDPETQKAIRESYKEAANRLRSDKNLIVNYGVAFAQFLQMWKSEGCDHALAWARAHHPFIYKGYMDARKEYQERQQKKNRRAWKRPQ